MVREIHMSRSEIIDFSTWSRTGPDNKIKAPANFLETSISQKIQTMVDVCLNANLIGLVTGAPGIGKSTTLRWIASQEPTYAVYVEVSPAQAALKPFCKLLSDNFGWGVDCQYQHQWWEVLVSRLPDEAKRLRYLMVDEAQTLDNDALRILVNFQEQFGMAVILAGNESTLRRKNSGPAFEQITDRIGFKLRLEGLLDSDFQCLGKNFGFTGEDACNFIIRYGKQTSLRKVEQLLSAAKLLAENEKMQPNCGHLKEMLAVIDENAAERITRRK